MNRFEAVIRSLIVSTSRNENKHALVSQYGRYIIKGQDFFPSLCSQMAALQAFANSHPELVPGSPIFDIPTEPVDCLNPATVNYLNICAGIQGQAKFFPQFYPAHNHDDYKVTNDGTYPGGQLILMQIDAPPQHCHNGYVK